MVLGLANLWWTRLPKNQWLKFLCICNERYVLTEKLEAAGEVNGDGEYEAEEGPHATHGHAAPWTHSGRVRTAPGCRLLLDQTEIGSGGLEN